MATKEEKAKTEKPQEAETRTVSVTKTAVAGSEAEAAEAASRSEVLGPGLEQIREILVGALFREVERRMARTDVHTGTRVKEIEQEARRRTEVLESHLRTELGALANRVENAFVDAADALHHVVREHRDATAALERRIAKAEEAGAAAQRELRTQLLDQAKTFLDELQHLRTELLATMQEELGASASELAEERGGAEERPRH
jgi:hypothetical protein